VMTGLLRDELGFRGAAITDGLEMGALGGGRSVGEGAVLALAAGCDGLLVGGGLSDEAVVDELVEAIVAAVEDGRVSEERLKEAADRLAAVSLPFGASRRLPMNGDDASFRAARLAVKADGDVRVGREAVVIRLESPSTIAAGDVPWGMAEALAARGVRIGKKGRVVIAVRDLHRQPGNQARIVELLEDHPDAVVVEMGVPVCRPQAARSYVATHGSARVCAEAAAERMTR